MNIKISALNEAIKEKGHDWVAEENHMTKMNPEERIKMLGTTIPDNPEMTKGTEVFKTSGASAPSSIDWRNNNGNFVTRIKNQGPCGSCVGFGSTAVFESMIAIEGVYALQSLSVADAFFCSSHGANCSGWWPSDYFTANKTRGVVADVLFPYSEAFSGGNPVCKTIPNRADHAYTYGKINSTTTVEAAKAYLSSTGPLAACFSVYQDFYGYKSGIYKHTTGKFEGNHCVCVVGYNDNNGDGYWICKNSWGPNWGDDGYFCIAYNQCNIDVWAKYGVTETKNAPTVPFYRLYNGTDHFYTASASEKNSAIAKSGYSSEGIACYVYENQVDQSGPFYRLYNGVDHLYTTSNVEKQSAEKAGYHSEGIACYIYLSQSNNSSPLYRLYNGTDHFYTTSEAEKQSAEKGGYTSEGIAGYVIE